MMPGSQVVGLDISDYVVENSMDSIHTFLNIGSARDSRPARPGFFVVESLGLQ